MVRHLVERLGNVRHIFIAELAVDHAGVEQLLEMHPLGYGTNPTIVGYVALVGGVRPRRAGAAEQLPLLIKRLKIDWSDVAFRDWHAFRLHRRRELRARDTDVVGVVTQRIEV